MTGETRELMYAVVHFGGHDFSCGVRAWEDAATYEAMKADLLGALRAAQHGRHGARHGHVLPRRAVRRCATSSSRAGGA